MTNNPICFRSRLARASKSSRYWLAASIMFLYLVYLSVAIILCKGIDSLLLYSLAFSIPLLGLSACYGIIRYRDKSDRLRVILFAIYIFVFSVPYSDYFRQHVQLARHYFCSIIEDDRDELSNGISHLLLFNLSNVLDMKSSPSYETGLIKNDRFFKYKTAAFFSEGFKTNCIMRVGAEPESTTIPYIRDFVFYARGSKMFHTDRMEFNDQSLSEIVIGISELIDHKAPMLSRLTKLSSNGEANYYYLVGISSYMAQKKGAYYDAEAYFKRALAIDPNFAEAKAGLAETIAQLAMRRWEDSSRVDYAIKLAENAVLNLQDSPACYKSLGVCFLAKYHFSARDSAGTYWARKALDVTRKSISLAPNYYAAQCNLISIYGILGDFNKAHNEYNIMRNNAPYFFYGYIAEGAVLIAEKRYEDAIEVIEKALGLNDDSGLAYYNLACAYARIREYSLSWKYFSIAMKYDDYNFSRIAIADPDLKEMLKASTLASNRKKH